MIQEICLGCKNLDDQLQSGWPETVDSKAELQAIEENPAVYQGLKSDKSH